MSQALMQWAPSNQKIVLEKWLEGDGDWNPLNMALKGTTVSRALAFQMMTIAARCGLAGSLCVDRDKAKKRTHKQKAYMLFFRGDNATELDSLKRPADFSPKVSYATATGHLKFQTQGSTVTRACAKPMSFCENGFVYRRLRKIKRVDLYCDVYDLTIPGDHGFVVNGVGVSNCKIPFDVSECCGHKAATIANHCSHVKESAGQYLPEFQKYAYVDNPYCKFFDISKVANPADRTAHYLAYRFPDQDMELAKAAAADLPILGSDWAAFEGVNLPSYENDEPLEWGDRQRYFFAKLAEASAYAHALTPEAFSSGDHKVAFVRLAGPNLFASDLSDEEMNTVRRIRPGTMMHEMSKRAMVMPFRSFVSYITNKAATEVEADVAAAESTMPAAWESMNKDACTCCNMHQEFSPDSEFMSGCDDGNDDVVQDFMDSAVEKFSIKSEPMQHRIIQITIKAGSLNSEKNLPSKEATALGNFYSQAYAQYLTQSLVAMEKLGHDVSDREVLALAGYVNSLAHA